MATLQGVPWEDGGIVLAATTMGRVGYGGIPCRACEVDNPTDAIPGGDIVERDC